jgi:acetyl esterase
MPTLWRKVARRAGGLIFEGVFESVTRLGRLHPAARPLRHRVELIRDISYIGGAGPSFTLDIYRPLDLDAAGQLPTILYVHGGSFRILSKDTHWIMGLAYARQGYIVFNINYRLAPKYRYPAAVDDVCQAYDWLARNGQAHGADLSRLALAGESAGANLALAVAIATSYRRHESWASRVWETGLVPRAVVAACGILQVSSPERFRSKKKLPTWVYDRIVEASRDYLPLDREVDLTFAEPLLFLEQGQEPDRPFPPCFAPCGTRDPLLPDSRRLKAALDRLGVDCEAPIYPGGVHAFHAMVWQQRARRCWRDTFRFLSRHLAR